MSQGERHTPVMLAEVVSLLAPALTTSSADPSILVDGTLGLAGHAEALLTACPQAHLIGLDRDPQALALAAERLAPFSDRTTLVEAVYDELPEVLADLGHPRVQAVLLDLGLSSLQIDEPERGFAYAVDAPLDMRMDGKQALTAAEVLNTYSVRDLARILRTYGEERFADRIARRIVAEREREPFTTSARLVDVLRDAIPMATRKTGGHPAKRTFQALRIEVNAELEALRTAVPAVLDRLAVGGRVVVLAYQSLEDRIVKQEFAARSRSTAPEGLPVELPEHAPVFRLLVRGSQSASESEVADNPRAASVRLRAAERLRPDHPRPGRSGSQGRQARTSSTSSAGSTSSTGAGRPPAPQVAPGGGGSA
jgi:16S rRNA (cytosine1402-N4)-methyltransferase